MLPPPISRQARLWVFKRDLQLECRNRLRNNFRNGDMALEVYAMQSELLNVMTAGGLCALVIELREKDRHTYRRLAEEPSSWVV